MTCQEQGSPVSPKVFSIPAPRASGHDACQQALKDPEFAKAVRGLELCLRVRERERLRDSGIDSCRVSNAGRQGLRSKSAGGGVDSASVLLQTLLEKVENMTLCATAILKMVWRSFDTGSRLLQLLPRPLCVSLLSPMRQAAVAGERVQPAAASSLRRSGPTAHATASESDRVIGLLEVTESEFPSLSYSVNSCLWLSTSACARCTQFVVGHG